MDFGVSGRFLWLVQELRNLKRWKFDCSCGVFFRSTTKNYYTYKNRWFKYRMYRQRREEHQKTGLTGLRWSLECFLLFFLLDFFLLFLLRSRFFTYFTYFFFVVSHIFQYKSCWCWCVRRDEPAASMKLESRFSFYSIERRRETSK